MKNVFGGLVKRLDIAEERISELEDISIETSKTENLREQRLEKNRTEYTRTVGQLQKLQHVCNGKPEREKRKEWNKYLRQ